MGIFLLKPGKTRAATALNFSFSSERARLLFWSLCAGRGFWLQQGEKLNSAHWSQVQRLAFARRAWCRNYSTKGQDRQPLKMLICQDVGRLCRWEQRDWQSITGPLGTSCRQHLPATAQAVKSEFHCSNASLQSLNHTQAARKLFHQQSADRQTRADGETFRACCSTGWSTFVLQKPWKLMWGRRKGALNERLESWKSRFLVCLNSFTPSLPAALSRSCSCTFMCITVLVEPFSLFAYCWTNRSVASFKWKFSVKRDISKILMNTIAICMWQQWML